MYILDRLFLLKYTRCYPHLHSLSLSLSLQLNPFFLLFMMNAFVKFISNVEFILLFIDGNKFGEKIPMDIFLRPMYD